MSAKKSNNFEGVFSDSEDEKVGSIRDPIDEEIMFKIQEKHEVTLRKFREYINDPEFITTKGDPTTNIVDRYSLIGEKIGTRTYHIPEPKLTKFFKYLDCFRRKKLKMMIYERQLEYSGIMVDFDIFQEESDSFVTDSIAQEFARALIKILYKYMDLNGIEDAEGVEEKKSCDIYVAVIKKEMPIFISEKQCYKDGFHVLIPSIKTTKEVKKFLLERCNQDEIFRDIFRAITPAKGYTYKDFIDLHSAYVPCHFVGSATKIGSPAYDLVGVYYAKVYMDDLERSEISPIINKVIGMDNSIECEYVICYELSLNWEYQLIKKHKYTVKENYLSYIKDIKNIVERDEAGGAENGELSLLKVHDPEISFIQNLLDTLHPSRYTDYFKWFKVMCLLANTSKSYKPLAEHFSMKCAEKYNPSDFEKYWEIASNSKKNTLTMGSLHYWAKLDNPEKYDEIRCRNIFDMLFKKIYDRQTDGCLQHYDIAQVLYSSLRHKYAYNISNGGTWYEFILAGEPMMKGEVYKWRSGNRVPNTLKKYISEVLPVLFGKIFDKINHIIEQQKSDEKSKYHHTVKKNLQISCRNLRNSQFKSGVGRECEQLFENVEIAYNMDKNPEIMGVGNGILVLGKDVSFITGYHNYLISQHTSTDYKEFDPFDEITKKLLISLRNLFPDDEPDTFNFMMHYLASALDGKKKESLLLLLVGNGSNGKSFLVELFKETIGEKYAIKMPLSFLTSRQKNSESATPALMMLVNARFAYYSETEKSEVLNSAKIKEITGTETLGGRRNFGDYINFKPTCHHLVTSNYDFEVNSTDHGTWRRLKRISMKIKFCKQNVDDYDEKNQYERVADLSLGSSWPDDPDVQSAFLSILVYYYLSLQNNYGGIVENVPHPTIKRETELYRDREDKINKFINSKFVKTVDTDVRTPMTVITEKYIRWHESIYPNDRGYDKTISLQLENSKLSKFIAKTRTGNYISGYRALDTNELPDEGERFFADMFEEKKQDSYIGAKSESSEEFYSMICKEYLSKKAATNKLAATMTASPRPAPIKAEFGDAGGSNTQPKEATGEQKAAYLGPKNNSPANTKKEYDMAGFTKKKSQSKFLNKIKYLDSDEESSSACSDVEMSETDD